MSKWVRWLLVVVVGVTIGFFIWQRMRTKPIEVVVKQVTMGTVEQSVANTRAGTVEACRRARLSPSIGGQIAALPITEGDQVQEGELLLELWNEDLVAQLNVATQEAEVAKAQAESRCQSAEEARRQADRAQTLFSRQVNSREQTDIAQTEAESLEAQCLAAQATVQRSVAQIGLARANLSRSRLRAPFSGVIAKIEGELNEYVTPSPVGVQTSPVVDLIENDCFYITAPIDEVDAAEVQIGMTTRISLDAFRGQEFMGMVRRIAPFVLDFEKQARTVDIEIDFDNPQDYGSMLAGYSADVEIIIEARHDTVRVPSEAVVDGTSVYIYDSEHQVVRKTDFTVGLANWTFTEVRSGLSEGQLVVTSIDKPGLIDGARAIRQESER